MSEEKRAREMARMDTTGNASDSRTAKTASAAPITSTVTERGPNYPLGEFDGSKWAAEFMRLFGSDKQSIDEGLMLAWFCNAIMTGYDEAMRRSALAKAGR